jgi:hypothetical protein
MIYDTELDDGPMLIDNPPCLHEDRNDILVIHDDALVHGNPILFLKSPIYTIEEKYAYVDKYLCDLQLSYEKSYCNHDAMIKNPCCMIQIFPLLNFLLIIATTMKEEVTSTLFMLLVMI